MGLMSHIVTLFVVPIGEAWLLITVDLNFRSQSLEQFNSWSDHPVSSIRSLWFLITNLKLLTYREPLHIGQWKATWRVKELKNWRVKFAQTNFIGHWIPYTKWQTLICIGKIFWYTVKDLNGTKHCHLCLCVIHRLSATKIQVTKNAIDCSHSNELDIPRSSYKNAMSIIQIIRVRTIRAFKNCMISLSKKVHEIAIFF